MPQSKTSHGEASQYAVQQDVYEQKAGTSAAADLILDPTRRL
jgi:hypothetical protein